MDQLIIPKLIVFFILITYLVDIVRRNSVLVTHESKRIYGEEDRERNNKGYCKTPFVLKEVVDLGLKVGNTLWKLLFTEILSNGL